MSRLSVQVLAVGMALLGASALAQGQGPPIDPYYAAWMGGTTYWPTAGDPRTAAATSGAMDMSNSAAYSGSPLSFGVPDVVQFFTDDGSYTERFWKLLKSRLVRVYDQSVKGPMNRSLGNFNQQLNANGTCANCYQPFAAPNNVQRALQAGSVRPQM